MDPGLFRQGLNLSNHEKHKSCDKRKRNKHYSRTKHTPFAAELDVALQIVTAKPMASVFPVNWSLALARAGGSPWPIGCGRNSISACYPERAAWMAWRYYAGACS